MKNPPDENAFKDLVREVLEKPKYQHIHKGLIETVATTELAKGRKKKETQKAVLSKLHQIGAAYFSQKPDYEKWGNELSSLPDDIHSDQAKAYCVKVMGSHYSTDERLPILVDFYQQILNSTKPIPSILDLACGLNPLALPWMPIDDKTRYYGCDIFTDMIDFLNTFAAHFGIHAKFETCNLLDATFNIPAKIAFLLKTTPCIEQLKKGFIPQLLDAIPAEYILFSYPMSSLSGKSKGMRENYTDQFTLIISSKSWEYERFEFSSELAFLVKKN